MVREILKEALAARAVKSPGSDVPTAPQTVRIASDADLQAFVARLARPGVIDNVRDGSLRFVLAEANGAGPAAPPHLSKAAPQPAAAASAAVTLDGVISERRLQSVPKGAVVHLAPGAVVTPLARDMARRLGLSVRRHDR
jgi:hypothetical protein